MKQHLDHFILAIPVVFIKQYAFAWIAAVALWTWPPVVPGIFLVIVALGLLMLRWQSIAWLSNLRREHASPNGKFHVDQPPVRIWESAQKVLILLIGAGVMAWFLKDRLGMGFWQFFIMIAGFIFFYYDTRFIGGLTTYAITDQGIGIRFVPGRIDYRVFIPFKDISRVEKSQFQKDRNWDLFARTRDTKDGLLMIPKNPDGFTKRIERLFIAPNDMEKFLEQLLQGCK
jgi:hypothetical protein